MAVQSVNSINNTMASPVRNVNNPDQSISFKDIMMDALNNVNALEQESAGITEDFISGRTDNIHSVLIAAEKASISLQFIMEVRNKVIEAYQEIMRMQI
ncbi:MAG TPA: flagellar hook-basal body complex protein FliE [Clostridiaceae bacterium]|jgi:flagellar hook-basal body complex protein FliE|nr:flagellar hook-basal body complex protein FliE [Clostridiaceae bacterium]